MKEFLATLTQRGQVTIPVEVRRVLGIRPREKLAFTIDGDQVCLGPATFTLESAYGSVKPLNTPEDFDKIIAEAMEEHAGELVGEMTKPSKPRLPRPLRRK